MSQNNDRATELALKHWEYIHDVLENAGMDREIIGKIGFHYRSAFVHGHRHGVEDLASGKVQPDKH